VCLKGIRFSRKDSDLSKVAAQFELSFGLCECEGSFSPSKDLIIPRKIVWTSVVNKQTTFRNLSLLDLKNK